GLYGGGVPRTGRGVEDAVGARAAVQLHVPEVAEVDPQAGGVQVGAIHEVGAAGRVAHRQGRGPRPDGVDVDGRGGRAADVRAVDRDLRAGAGTGKTHTGDGVVEREGADAVGRIQPVVVRVGGSAVVRDPAAAGITEDMGPGIRVEQEEGVAV